MLVLNALNMNLRTYLQINHNQITWKERIVIVHEIIDAIYFIHVENAIHKDLHPGNALYSENDDCWYISDLGLCGPADKLPEQIYGNLPYIAPETISRKEYTFAS